MPTMPTSAIKQFSLDAEPPDRVGCHNRVGTTIPKKVFRITFYVGTAFHMLLFHYLGCDKVVTFKIYVPLSALTLTLAVALAAKIQKNELFRSEQIRVWKICHFTFVLLCDS